MPSDHVARKVSLKRRELERSSPVMTENELNRAVAEPA
jgi:hypothetical protein